MPKLKILCLLALLLANKLVAGDETRSSRAYANQFVPGAFIQTRDDKFTGSAGWVNGFTNYANRGVVEFALDEEKHNIMLAQKFCAKFDVAVTDANLITTIYTNQQLDINYNPFEQTRYKDKSQLIFQNAYKVKVYNVTINSCNISTPNCAACTTAVYAGNDVYLQAEITTTRIYNFNFSSALAAGGLRDTLLVASQELQIDWAYVSGAESYELEYTYVNNYSSTLGSYLPSTGLNYDLDHDATRISTTQNYYKIPLTYESGYIIYRLRPVGKSSANIRMEGTWFGAPAIGAVSGATYSRLISTLNSDALNWQSVKTFAENGKTGTGISFSDALGYKRQSLARLNTDQKTIAQSTLYDYYGRPAVNLLPSPVNGLTFNYRFNLNKSSLGAEFEKSIFDNVVSSNPCVASGFALNVNTSLGAANYYSPQNNNKDGFQGYVPDAAGLPYTQVQLKPDGLGRVTAQTMPGATHQLGSGKEIKYFYSKPTQVELDRLFGSEAPRAIHCFKNYVIDPNGQMSTTYIDQYGRTMATALVGNPPLNVDPLSNLPTSTNFTEDFALIPTNRKDTAEQCIEVNTTIFVAEANTPQGFLYKTTLGEFAYPGCTPNLCYDCIYDLQLSIKDDCGQEIFDYDLNSGTPPGYNNSIGGTAPYAAGTCNGVTSIQITGGALNTPIQIPFVKVGTYTVYKKICVSDAPMDNYTQNFIDNQTCINPCTYVNNLMSGGVINFTGCGPQSCQQCQQSISDYRSLNTKANYTVRFNPDGSFKDTTDVGPIYPDPTDNQLSQWQEECAELCGPSGNCDKYQRAMLADFYPGTGQYAVTDNTGARWSGSIMNAANTLFTGYNWASPTTYKMADGVTSDKVKINGVDVLPQNLTSNQYSVNYRKSWAKEFLSKHPENCKRYFYCNVIGASTDFDDQLKKITHYDAACAAGLILPLGVLGGSPIAPPANTCGAPNADPILTSLAANTSVIAFKTELLNNLYNNTSKSIYHYVAAQYYATIPGGYKFGQDECNRDAIWDMFKNIYLAKKYALYKALYTAYQANPSSFGYTSGSCPVSFPAAYVSHFPTWGDTLNKYIPGSPSAASLVDNIIATDDPTALNTIKTNVLAANTVNSADAIATCANYTDLWKQNLNIACPAYNSASAATKNNILIALAGVCQKGYTTNNPLGASTVPTGNGYVITPANVTVNSFQDVLNYYLGANACNAGIISQPPPYPLNGSGLVPTSGNGLSSCNCDQLLQVSANYQTLKLANNLPAGVTEEWQLFRKTYGYDLQEYYTLKCFCNNAVTSNAPSIPWTPSMVWSTAQKNALAGYPLKVNSKFTCPSCISCGDVTTAMNSLVLPSTNAFVGVIEKIKNDSTNTYYAIAALNGLFGQHSLQFYFDLYNDCQSFNSVGTQAKTFSNNITTEALDLFTYLNQLVKNKNLQKNNRALSICQDDKYYLSSIYTNGVLPTISALTYNYTIAGSSLNFTIKDAGLNNILAVTLTLPAGYLGTWASLKQLNNFVAYCATPVAGPNYGFKVDATDASFNNLTITGSITNLAFPICNLSSGPTIAPMACPKKAKQKNTCAATLISNALVQGKVLFEQELQKLVASFQDNYKQNCFLALSETFSRTYKFTREYNYTLYYYDEAGNLQRTVAPGGVVPLNITTNINPTPLQYPSHSSEPNGVSQQYVSDYRFNFANQPVQESTIDGGTTRYLYDNTGRILASQNAKQAAASGGANFVYSYTIYDAIGRIKEVGEMTTTTNLFLLAGVYGLPYSSYTPIVSAAISKKQVSRTYYDDYSNIVLAGNATAFFSIPGNALNNLRNHVAAVVYADDPSINTYDHATFYSYDDHGNVERVVQQNRLLPNALSGGAGSYNMEFKTLNYDYDLISGNVLKAMYQPNQPDQFIHKYYYDADNRLQEVYTSKDNLNWDRDAKYFYYEHGPLARIERADKQVQGADYYYTIHGWLKGINSDIMQPDNDAGKDGAVSNAYLSNYNKIHAYFAKDAMAFALNYYNNVSPTLANMDYTAIKAANFTSSVNDLNPSSNLTSLYATSAQFYLDNVGAGDGPSLYNGNISSMVTSFIDKDATNNITNNIPFPQLTAYRYDQLHRITFMKAHRSLTGNAWNAASASNYDDSYRMNFSYDKNGNLLSLFRYGAAPTLKTGSALSMDDLSYKYIKVSNGAGINSNKLYAVFDAATGSTYTEDIKAPTTSVPWNGGYNRYSYDEIGNLKSDIGEYIATIEWTVDRKVKRITRDAAAMLAAIPSVTKPDIEYEYNAMRQRVTKIVKPRNPTTKALLGTETWIYTYYIYDAAGNVMAVYDRSVSGVGPYDDVLKLSENHVYGSSRLALQRPVFDNLTTWKYSFTSCGTNCRTVGTITNPLALNTSLASRNLGYKEFELNNHLGNVIATVSDRKIILTACPDQFLRTFNDGITTGLNPVNANIAIVSNMLKVTPTAANAAVNFTYPTEATDKLNIAFDINLGNSIAADSISATAYAYNSGTSTKGPRYSKIKIPTNGTYNLSFTGPLVGSGYNSVFVEFNTKSTTRYFNIDNIAIAKAALGGSPTNPPCSLYVSLFMGYFPDLLMHTDYYAFGQAMPAREWTASNYRYSHNGHEKQDELFKGAQSAEYWMYDSRIGRRWERDPIIKPWESPYATFANNPIFFADPDGLTASGGGDKPKPMYTPKEKPKGASSIGLDGKRTFHKKKESTAPKDNASGSDLKSASTGGGGGIPTGNSPGSNKTANNIVNNGRFEISLTGKMTIGIQAKMAIGINKLFGLEAGLNLAKVDVVKSNITVSNPHKDVWSYSSSANYLGNNNQGHISQEAKLELSASDYPILEGYYKNDFDVDGINYIMNSQKLNYGVSIVVPLIKKNTSTEIQMNTVKDAAKALQYHKNTAMKSPKTIQDDKNFHGYEIGFGAALFLGVDLNLKVGFRK